MFCAVTLRPKKMYRYQIFKWTRMIIWKSASIKTNMKAELSNPKSNIKSILPLRLYKFPIFFLRLPSNLCKFLYILGPIPNITPWTLFYLALSISFLKSRKSEIDKWRTTSKKALFSEDRKLHTVRKYWKTTTS